ncbi:MAG: tetratricopeptide repeat protein [Phycisphaerales bacterium]|nr:tetratricopeptide repeat protein [Phycisphaerales bacterium]
MAKQADPRVMQAMQALAHGNAQEADSLCRAALADKKRDDLAMAVLAQVCNSTGKYEEGLQLIKNAIAKNGKRADYHGLLADMLTTQGDFRGALRSYDNALKYNSEHQGVIAGKANTFLRLNEPAKALALIEPIINKGDEEVGISIVYAKALIEHGNPIDASEVLLGRLPAKQESVETRRTLYFILGKAMELAGECESAFEAYEEGNHLSAGDFDLNALVTTHDNMIDSFPADSFASIPSSTNEDSSRVFIVGMLRSGSTLTEQIIDAHPNGQGLGELETLPRILHEEVGERPWSTLTVDELDAIANRYLTECSHTSHASAIVDKQLGNYQNLGMIRKLFPCAKIIHCTRNPLSMGVSCFSQKLPPYTNHWASSLHGIGHFYNEYIRLMQHWDEVLGESMLTVSYEQLVADQEGTTNTILNFVGLDFNPKCMEFWKTGRAVLTLSQDQVRRPMYNSSVARHERFKKLLDPLRDALGM